MKGDPLPAGHRVLRYVGASKIQEGVVQPRGFEVPNNGDISVNWMECGGEETSEEQVARVRKLVRMSRGTNAKFAEVAVNAIRRIKPDDNETPLDVIEDPLPATAEWPAAPCHAEIVLPDENGRRRIAYARLAEAVVERYDAVEKGEKQER